MTPKRGEVWWVRLDPTEGSEIAKTRPCVVVSDDVVNEIRRTVVVIPLSTSPQAHPPLMVQVNFRGGFPVAVVDQIRAVSKGRLDKRMGVLAPGDLKRVEEAMVEVLGLG